ncbi:MAG: hypothetical protein LUQ07_07925 [Methanospirillum sp.]|nr:hypothetical protein [Methanospirillum sp.]
MFLGDYIVIEKQITPYHFSCSCVSTGTEFDAVVDPDKRDFFDNTEFPENHPHACRFLRPAGGDRIVCTIHETSPAQCKIYRCIILRIFRFERGQVGYITGTGALHTADPVLRGVFDEGMKKLPRDAGDPEAWIADYLSANGYQVQ